MTRLDPRNDRHDAAPAGVRLRVVAIGDLVPPDPAGDGAETPDVAYLAFQDITPTILALLRPDMVVSPLVGPDYDCFDVADLLTSAGFDGRYRALAQGLPNPDIVRAEITDRFPALDLDLVVLDTLPGASDPSGDQ